MTLPTYREWRPTGFDCAGLGLPDRQDWRVGPVMLTRDSGCLDRSNWAVIVDDLDTCASDPNETEYEVHRFNHWGPGWFEIILVKPGTKTALEAERWARKLAEYPIADENHFSDLETREALEYWDHMSLRERVQVCSRYGVSIFAARHPSPPDNSGVWEYLTAE